MISLGFREEEGGLLVLPVDTDISHLEARKLELETGLERLRLLLKTTPVNTPVAVVESIVPSKQKLRSKGEEEVGEGPEQRIDAPNNRTKFRLETEEREKLRKAEATIRVQRDTMMEMQQQLSQLQDREAANLTLRQGLTISRLEPNMKSLMHTETNPISTEEFAFHYSIPEATVAPAVIIETKLSAAVKKGSVRLPVESRDGIRKGMTCIVGKGSKFEAVKVVDFGSLIVSPALRCDHPSGTIVRVYPPSPKNQGVVNSILAWELVGEVFFEEILSTVFLTVDTFKSTEDAICGADVTKTAYFLELEAPVTIASISSNVFDSQILDASLGICGGEVNIIDKPLGAIDLLLLFYDSCEDSLGTASLDALKNKIRTDTYTRNMLQFLTCSDSLITLERQLENYATNSTILWSSYLSFLKGKVSRQSILSNRTETDYSLLCHLFDILDWTDERSLSIHTTIRAFAELDGVMLSSEAFKKSVGVVFGIPLDEIPRLRLNVSDFIALREEYASSLSTLTAGMRLHGRRILLSTASMSLPTKIPFEQLIDNLPSSILDSVYLPLAASLRSLLSAYPDDNSSDLASMMGIRSIAGSNKAICYPMTCDCREIHEVIVSPSGRHMYTLLRSGVLRVHDIFSGEVLCQQRVVWAEARPSRNIEGYDKFLEWLERASGTGNDMEANIAAIEATSSALSEFMLSFDFFHLLEVDSSAGMLLVNNSINCNALTIIDPLSLRRIYRILSPVKLSRELNNAVDDIVNGMKPKTVSVFRGVISRIAIMIDLNVVLCSSIGVNSIYILNLLNGDVLTKLGGHQGAISFLKFNRDINIIFSGSSDSTIRMWNPQESVPMAESPGNSFGHATTEQLETKISGRLKKSANNGIIHATIRSNLLSLINTVPVLVKCKVIGFLDTSGGYTATFSQSTIGVELLFLNGTVKTFSNIGHIMRDSEYSNSCISVGEVVEVLHVDSFHAAFLFCKHVGLALDDELSRAKFESCLHTLIPTVEDKLNISHFIEDLFEGIDSQSILSIFLKLFQYEDKISNRCAGLLSDHHAGEIVDVAYCSAPNLVVSVDSNGVCCIWEIDGWRQGIFKNSRSGLTDCISLVGKKCVKADVFGKVKGLLRTSMSSESRVYTSVTHEQISKCIALDTQFVGSNCIRGFIYVYSSQELEIIETSCFSPALLSLDTFDDKNTALPAPFKRIFENRHYIIRAVYAASVAHKDMISLVHELRVFGVFTGNCVNIPSELIRAVCFNYSGTMTTMASMEDRIHIEAHISRVPLHEKEIDQKSRSTLNNLIEQKTPAVVNSSSLNTRVDAADMLYIHLASSDYTDILIGMVIGQYSICTQRHIGDMPLSSGAIEGAKSPFRTRSEANEGQLAARKMLSLAGASMSRVLSEMRNNAATFDRINNDPPRSVISLFKCSLDAIVDTVKLWSKFSSCKTYRTHPMTKYYLLLCSAAKDALNDIDYAKRIVDLWLHSDFVSFNDLCAHSKYIGVQDVSLFEIQARRLLKKLTLDYVSLEGICDIFRMIQAPPAASFQRVSVGNLLLLSPLQTLLLFTESKMQILELHPSKEQGCLDKLLMLMKYSNKAVHDVGHLKADSCPVDAFAGEFSSPPDTMTGVFTVESSESMEFRYPGVKLEKLDLSSDDNRQRVSVLFLRCESVRQSAIEDSILKIRSLGLGHLLLMTIPNVNICNFDTSGGIVFFMPKDMSSLSSLISRGSIIFSKDCAAILNSVLTELYAALCSLEEKGLSCINISPSSVFIDMGNYSVKFLFTIFYGSDDPIDASQLTEYTELVEAIGSAHACVPPADDKQICVEKWMSWSFGAILYELTFGLPYVYPENASGENDEFILLHNIKAVAAPSVEACSDFDVILRRSGLDFKQLQSFRDAFAGIGSSSGMAVPLLTWEKLIQSVFIASTHEHGSDQASLSSLLENPPPLFEEADVAAYFSSVIGIEMNQTEAHVLLHSFVKNNYIPFLERSSNTLKGLRNCLEEAVLYGNFQQILYILSRTLQRNISRRGDLEVFRHLKILKFKRNGTAIKIDAYSSSKEFIQKQVLSPLKLCFLSLLENSNLNMDMFSSSLTEVESVLCSILRKTETLESENHMESEQTWIHRNCEDALINLCICRAFEFISSCCIMFNSMVEMGERIIARVVNFLRFAIDVYLNSSEFIDKAIDGAKGVDDMPCLILMKNSLDQLFASIISSLLMLYYGEEVPVSSYGNYSPSVPTAFPHLNLSSKNTVYSKSRWEATIHGTSEPLLLQLLGESGTGSRKLKFVMRQIYQMDSLVEVDTARM